MHKLHKYKGNGLFTMHTLKESCASKCAGLTPVFHNSPVLCCVGTLQILIEGRPISARGYPLTVCSTQPVGLRLVGCNHHTDARLTNTAGQPVSFLVELVDVAGQTVTQVAIALYRRQPPASC